MDEGRSRGPRRSRRREKKEYKQSTASVASLDARDKGSLVRIDRAANELSERDLDRRELKDVMICATCHILHVSIL